MLRRRVTVTSLADICGTDVEIFHPPFATTIYVESRSDAPAALLDQLDALGLQRCSTEPRGVWHQVPGNLNEPAGHRLASDAATALTKAGWSVNIDPGALATETDDHAAITAAINNRSRAGQVTAEPAAGSTPHIRGIATPSTDRYPALLALDTAHLLDRVTESLVRADANRGGFIVMTSIVPEISPLAALGRLLNAAGTHLNQVASRACAAVHLAGYRVTIDPDVVDEEVFVAALARPAHRPQPPAVPASAPAAESWRSR